MYIIKSKQYNKDYKKIILDKHLNKESEIIENIEVAIIMSANLKNLINSNMAITYNIEKKKGNLKEIYTARINKKLRLYIKPLGSYPYDNEEIVEVEFVEIDDKHYGEG